MKFEKGQIWELWYKKEFYVYVILESSRIEEDDYTRVKMLIDPTGRGQFIGKMNWSCPMSNEGKVATRERAELYEELYG